MWNDTSKQDKINQEHASNPQVGDYWSEMFSPVAVVASVTPYYVIVIEKKSVDDSHWQWDLDSKPNVYTREEFVFRFTYGRIDDIYFRGDSDPDSIKNKFWCNVSPEAHKYIEKELEEKRERVCLE